MSNNGNNRNGRGQSRGRDNSRGNSCDSRDGSCAPVKAGSVTCRIDVSKEVLAVMNGEKAEQFAKIFGLAFTKLDVADHMSADLRDETRMEAYETAIEMLAAGVLQYRKARREVKEANKPAPPPKKVNAAAAALRGGV